MLNFTLGTKGKVFPSAGARGGGLESMDMVYEDIDL